MINIDLYGDWIRLLADELRAQGYEVGDGEDPLAIAVSCFNARHRALGQVSRRVHRGRSLADFPQHKEVVDTIQAIAEQGGDLRPYVSDRLTLRKFNDDLLNDWGLHHLHLGSETRPDGFVKRSGPLLFVHATKTDLYMVTIKGHGAWTDTDLLEEVLANWPELLEPFETSLGIVGQTLTPAEHAACRRGGVVGTVLSNGKTYLPLGGGASMTGSNIRFVHWHDRVDEFLEWVESDIRNNLEDKRRQLPPGVDFGSPPTFKLQMRDNMVVAIETTALHGFGYPFP